MAILHTLGYPRIGPQRELKFALEAYWRGNDAATADALATTAESLRGANWKAQADAGFDFVTVGDFALYDHVLAHLLWFDALPQRFRDTIGGEGTRKFFDTSFALARGTREQPALEMTKWFDTNYHFLVPEFSADESFDGNGDELLDAVAKARAAGHTPKVVLVGPVTLLRLSRCTTAGVDRLTLLPALLKAYRRLLGRLKEVGVQWVQIDEPALCLDLPENWLAALELAYQSLGTDRPQLLLATYFGSVAEHWDRLAKLPVDGIHLDLVRAPEQLDVALKHLPPHWVLSAGVIDGRNLWRADLASLLDSLEPLTARLGDRLWLAPSCSLLHVPVSLAAETALPVEVQPWLAFAEEKLQELAILGRGLADGRAAIAAELAVANAAIAARQQSPLRHNQVVARRLAAITSNDTTRRSPYPQRRLAQQQRLQLPPLPTTTIGSFPQTAEIRAARGAMKRGALGAYDYLQAMRAEIRRAVEEQEALDIDVLVHGEPERNDMVEYFAEQLWGICTTAHGWVQSYGSRCVKPPIIYGDVYRPEPMTVEATQYAQSLTQRPVKGMLTGPVTLLQWSFVRDDQPREATALQLALAVRDEVNDLEQAGVAVIQIDEPAFREGLPLRAADWAAYLDWATRAFRLASCSVRDDTQIHTHMCYSEFNDILPAIAALDADVITIETSRSQMALLDGFSDFAYPNEIGPGVYDIHSPRVPSTEDMLALLRRAASVIPADRLWVNPDCGLKTRGWPETRNALGHMVAAAKALRKELGLADDPQAPEGLAA